MKRMVEDSLDEQVAAIIRTLDERKTRQFTSQNSGMIFKEIPSVTGSIGLINSQSYGGEVHVITNTFTPKHNRPAICMPYLEIGNNGYKFNYYRDYSLGYENISISDQADNYVGYMDVWAFYHRSGNSGYSWQTVIYTWGNRVASFPFAISLRATDDGTHTYIEWSHVL